MIKEIVAFIKARLAEDEAVARTAARHANLRGGSHHKTARWTTYLEGGDDGYAIESEDAQTTFIVGRQDVAEHIARHDPARVLRDVEAKQRILARYQDAIARQNDPAYSRPAASIQVAEYEDWVLPLLALAWDAHPAFDEAWRP
ncbi:DUF6221 family protein [Dactylosporangium sp. CA-139066]|uniref:DUF6221 family protein n=1 Tax=Dactylosporangium sp. CA-139066 TaxID=3239930 RepID=UPI003D915044